MSSPLGRKIRDLRQEKGFTLEQLATAAGASKSYMWEIENKPVARPSAEKLAKIAEALGVTTEYLLDDNRSEPSTDERDEAFFHRFQSADKNVKKKLSQILDLLAKEDDDK